METNKIHQGDCLEILKTFPDESINCVVTSPPYWGLRDYGHNGQIGLEKSPELYVEKLVNIFSEIKRILKNDGSLWLNLGDCYAGAGGMGSFVDNKAKKGMQTIKQYVRNKPIEGLKPKDLIGIPWRVAFALQANGWYLRSDIIWHKPNPMPESVKDRPTKAHEYIFLLTKNDKYYYDYQSILEIAAYDGRKDTKFKGSERYKNSSQTFAARGHERWANKVYPNSENQTMHKMKHSAYIREDGKELFYRDNGIPARNKRTVWTVNTKPFRDAHFAVFPPELIVDCIKAGCP